MKQSVKVIVEKHHDKWSAWFAEVPQAVVGGASPFDAVQQLLDYYVPGEFDSDKMAAIKGTADDLHQEFMIPRRNRGGRHNRSVSGVPGPSEN